MLNLRSLDFKKYHWSNRDFFYVKGKKGHLSNVAKVTIALNLIRNRAFHWENLLKTRKINEKIFPRITTKYPQKAPKENQVKIGVMPEMIVEFLEDLIRCIGNPEIDKSLREIIGD